MSCAAACCAGGEVEGAGGLLVLPPPPPPPPPPKRAVVAMGATLETPITVNPDSSPREKSFDKVCWYLLQAHEKVSSLQINNMYFFVLLLSTGGSHPPNVTKLSPFFLHFFTMNS